MATSGEPPGHVTRKQIVRLAAAISADTMESIAEGYMDICNEAVKNIWRENQGKAEAFNRDVLRHWTNKHSGPSQIRVRNISCNVGIFSAGPLKFNFDTLHSIEWMFVIVRLSVNTGPLANGQ